MTYPNEEVGITVEDIEERYKDRFSEKAIKKRMNQILDKSDDSLFLVAKDEDKVIGVCKIKKKKKYNELEAIYVLPNYHRKGIGMMFWKKTKEFFGNNKDIVVCVATYNNQAISFYQKLGFIDTGKRFTQDNFKMPISGSYIPEMEMIIRV